MTEEKKLLAWLSDHAPSQEQISSLAEHGYDVLQIPSPQPNRWASAQHAFTTMMRKCERLPDAIVMILPADTMGGMFIKMAKNIPIYRPEVYAKDGGKIVWTGRWLRLKGAVYRFTVADRI